MITGNPGTKIVQIDGKRLDPGPSQRLYNHSPDGFAWGYGGSGPSQLSLAILLHFTDKEFALAHYQKFKADVIARASMYNDLHISNRLIRSWTEKHGYEPSGN